ncbi:hypothetical protein DsansV1_C22g0170721 [Dioscorea sansibarensis]
MLLAFTLSCAGPLDSFLPLVHAFLLMFLCCQDDLHDYHQCTKTPERTGTCIVKFPLRSMTRKCNVCCMAL